MVFILKFCGLELRFALRQLSGKLFYVPPPITRR